jgi:Skp family chaperone for outer membrane proteins
MPSYVARKVGGLFLLAIFAASMTSAAAAQGGIKVTASDKVLFGTADRCLRPVQVDYKKLQHATPELKRIKDEGIEAGSAQHGILIQKMSQRLQRVVKAFAELKGYDCVVIKGAVRSSNGIEVPEVTDDLLDEMSDQLES